MVVAVLEVAALGGGRIPRQLHGIDGAADAADLLDSKLSRSFSSRLLDDFGAQVSLQRSLFSSTLLLLLRAWGLFFNPILFNEKE